MTARLSRQRLFGKVMVPDEVHKAVLGLKMTYPEIAIVLGIARCTVDEFANPGGSVRESTLERVKERLAELGHAPAAEAP